MKLGKLWIAANHLLFFNTSFIDLPLSFRFQKRKYNQCIYIKTRWLISKAKNIIARHEFSVGNYAKSKITFENVVGLSDYDEGAEAKY